MHTDEGLGEIENAIAQFVPARMTLTVAEYLNLCEDDCNDSLSPEESVGCLSEDVYNAAQCNGDLDHELKPMTPEVPAKDALKALGIVSTLQDESTPQDKVSLTAVSQKQRELPGKKANELRQTTMASYFKEQWRKQRLGDTH